jgi:hypothetical protein
MRREAPVKALVTLGDVRWLDAVGLLASCKTCGYEAVVEVKALPDFVPLSWFAEQFICKRCDGSDAYILPSWGDRSQTNVDAHDVEMPILASSLAP